MGAGVVDGEELAIIGVEDRDRYAPGLGTVEAQGFTGLNCRAQTSGEHGWAFSFGLSRVSGCVGRRRRSGLPGWAGRVRSGKATASTLADRWAVRGGRCRARRHGRNSAQARRLQLIPGIGGRRRTHRSRRGRRRTTPGNPTAERARALARRCTDFHHHIASQVLRPVHCTSLCATVPVERSAVKTSHQNSCRTGASQTPNGAKRPSLYFLDVS